MPLVNKEQVDKYYFRADEGFGWAVIILFNNTIMIHSDYGDWAYTFGAPGGSLKEFLQKTRIDYISSKFKENDYFDFEKTVNAIDARLRDSFNDGRLSKGQYELAYIDLSSIDYCRSGDWFMHQYLNSPVLRELIDPMDVPIIKTVSPQFEAFWNKIWLIFIEQLNQEPK